jgi:hypothetical protein
MIKTEFWPSIAARIYATVTFEDPLQQEKWVFSYNANGHALQLDEYVLDKRESTRHKFRTFEKWSRIDKRDNTIPVHPPPNYAVLKAVKDCFIENLTIQPPV